MPEIGFDTFLDDGKLTLKATGFFQRFQDIIDYSGDAPAGTPSYFNVAGANANGLELEAFYNAPGGVTFSGNYTYLATRTTKLGFDSTSSASYVVGQPLIRRPQNAWTLSALQRYAGGARLTLVAAYVGLARGPRLRSVPGRSGDASRLHESRFLVRAAAAVACARRDVDRRPRRQSVRRDVSGDRPLSGAGASVLDRHSHRKVVSGLAVSI